MISTGCMERFRQFEFTPVQFGNSSAKRSSHKAVLSGRCLTGSTHSSEILSPVLTPSGSSGSSRKVTHPKTSASSAASTSTATSATFMSDEIIDLGTVLVKAYRVKKIVYVPEYRETSSMEACKIPSRQLRRRRVHAERYVCYSSNILFIAHFSR